jgi:beta-lactamase class C
MKYVLLLAFCCQTWTTPLYAARKASKKAEKPVKISASKQVYMNHRILLQEQALASKINHFLGHVDQKMRTLQGCAIAIVYKGDVLYRRTFGHKRGKQGTINTETLFPLASVSKAVSATAIALLVENNLVDLDAKIDLPYLKNTVNLTHILSHSTGYDFTGNREIESGYARHKILENLRYKDVLCSPGNCYRYSNITFSLVEEALNKHNVDLQFAIDNLRKSLQLSQLELAPSPELQNVAYPHVVLKSKRGIKKTQPLPFPPHYPRTVPASAGVFASIDSMVEILRLSFGYRDDLLSYRTLKRFQTPIVENKKFWRWDRTWPGKRGEVEAYYGLGWRILRSKQCPEKELIYHGGYIAGVVSFIGYIPSEEVGIVILVNQDSGFAIDSGFGFWGEFLRDFPENKQASYKKRRQA